MQAFTVFVFIILGACANGTPVDHAHNAGAAKQVGTFGEVSHRITGTLTKGGAAPKALAVPTIQPLMSAPLSLAGNNTTISQESLSPSLAKETEELVAASTLTAETESTTTSALTTLVDISKKH